MRFLQSGAKGMKVKNYLMDRFSLLLSYIISLCLFGLVLQLQSLLEKRSI
ncbi:ATPase, partial [Malaciobacter molluscorum]